MVRVGVVLLRTCIHLRILRVEEEEDEDVVVVIEVVVVVEEGVVVVVVVLGGVEEGPGDEVGVGIEYGSICKVCGIAVYAFTETLKHVENVVKRFIVRFPTTRLYSGSLYFILPILSGCG